MRERISRIVAEALNLAEVEITPSPRVELGHYSTNVAMRLAKGENKNPYVLAQEFAKRIRDKAPAGFFEKVGAMPPGFVNLWLSPAATTDNLKTVLRVGRAFGQGTLGRGRTIIVEHSSLNIAKPVNVGHLRNAALGDALANLHAALGYKVVRWNYLGDWGTQFGKLIAAYKLWGNKKEIEKDPIQGLLGLYVRFHDEAKSRPELEDMGRQEFRKLERGDKENRRLWTWFKKESLREFDRVYKQLNIKFDVEIGESFFEKNLKAVVDELIHKELARPSEGALVVMLDRFNLPPALIQKWDGTSLYLTREIANLKYRLKKYKPAKILHVVGNEQALHFNQLAALAQLLGLDQAEVVHVKYGLVLAEGGKKFATREGRIVTAEDVIQKAIVLARETVAAKRPNIASRERERIARAVALGALKYTNLRENRISDVVFDWQKMLDFSGDSAPYLQYTYARFRNILRKAGWFWRGNVAYLKEAEELRLARKLLQLPDVIEDAAAGYAPNLLTLYLYELANLANRFYEATHILKDKDAKRRNARLLLIKATTQVFKNGLGILGIAAPEKI